MKDLVLQHKNCIGCKICELVCSFSHFKKFKKSLSGIKIIKYDELSRDIPTVCQQCDDAPCQKVCKVGALCRNLQTNAIIIDYETCIGCKLCIYVCPYGSIGFDDDLQKPVKCDLCNGDPECVKFCPSEALVYKEIEESISKKRKEVADKEL